MLPFLTQFIGDSSGNRARRTFSAHIKQFTATRAHRCHPKHGTPLTLEPLWRMTISLNDEPERLQVLPPLDVDLVDKILLLKVQSNPMPMPTTTPREKEVFWNTLKSELPAFVDFLAHYTIPVELCDTRCGIAPFHHLELPNKLQETTPEQHLLELVDLVHFCGSRADAWSGTATQLTAMLQNDSRLGSQAASCFTVHKTAAPTSHVSLPRTTAVSAAGSSTG